MVCRMLPNTRKSESILRDPKSGLQMLSVAGRTVLVLFIVAWISWFAPFDDLLDRSGTPLGGDYIMLYVAGETLNAGDGALLYDDAANQQRSSAQFPTMNPNESWPYRYPPVTAWLMQPLSHLDFAWSFGVFFLLACGCLLFTTKLLLREFVSDGAPSKRLVFWSLLGWPIVGEALIGGQSSPIALCLVVAAAIALKHHRDVLAGALIGLCIYKPNIVGVLVIGTLIARPRAFWGMLAVAVPAMLLSIYATGIEGAQRYVELASSLASSEWKLETPFWKVHGLAPMLDALAPGRGKLLAFAMGVPIACGLGLQMRHATQERYWLIFATLMMANALFNPYVPIYDMLLLLPAVIGTVAWLLKKDGARAMPTVVAIVVTTFIGPHLSQAIAPTLGWQPFPLALTAIFILQLRELRSFQTDQVSEPAPA